MARRYYNNRAPAPGRWMDLRYAGTCSVCETALPAGARGFYEPSDKTVTCTALECADHRGLTTTKAVWPNSVATVLSPTRLASADRGAKVERDPFAKTRSRGYYGRDAGRCEDAPCCGCCTY